MKKILLFASALAGLFLAGSCQRENLEPMESANTVTYTVQVADAVETKALGDDVNAVNELVYEVWRTAGTEITGFNAENDNLLYHKTAEVKNGVATVEIEFVNDQNFTILFWAHTKDNGVYDVDDLTSVTITSPDVANNVNAQAFVGRDFVRDCVSDKNGKVTLVRPVSQLNIATSPESLVFEAEAGETGSTVSLEGSSVKVKGLATSYNIATLSAFGALATEYTYTETAVPDDVLTVNGKNYTYVAMNYVGFAPEMGTSDVTVSYVINTSEGNIDNEILNVPVKPNYRTNIIGNLITSKTDYTITLDNEFANEYVVEGGTNYVSISSAEELVEVVSEIAAGNEDVNNIMLSGDIDLADLVLTRSAVASNWTPIGTEEKPYTGVFDGNGYTIKNLALVEAEAKEGKAFIGFFGYAKDATIKNVTFENVYINIPCLDIDHSQGHIGAVAGSLEGTSTIENVTVKGDIKVEATVTANGASRVAVVAGGNSYGNVTMKNVHVIAKDGSYLKANNNVGALAGQLQGKSVFENCSSNIDVTGTKFFAGGIIGLAAGDQTFTNCHTTGDITITAGRLGKAHDHYRVGGIAGGWADGAKNVCTLTNCSYTGELSGTNADGSVAETFDYAGYVGRGYTLNGCKGSKVVIDGVEYVQAFNTAAEAGIYTVNGYHEIATVADLKRLATMVNAGEPFEGMSVKLVANIDLNNEEWTPIGSAYTDHGFMGNFDGNGYAIKNLKMTKLVPDSDNYVYAGLFGVTEGTATQENYIKNLVIENVTIETTGDIVTAGIAYPYYTTVEDVTVKGNVNIKGGDYTSGVLAYTRRCVNAKNLAIVASANSVIEGNMTVGGVISDIQMNGGLTANYSNFTAKGLTIKGVKCVGGISGIIANQTLDGATVNDVALICSDIRTGIVAGAKDRIVTIKNVSYDNVTGATHLIGASYDGTVISVATADELIDALENGKGVYLENDIKIDPANMSNAYGKTGINVKNGQTIDGNGHTLNIQGAGGTWDSGINTTGGLIKNLTVTGSFRGIFINHNSDHSEKVVLENVTITGTVYTISCDQGLYQGIEATNCTFNGWTSFAKTAGEAKFINCSFGEGSGYKYCRPYSKTEFVECTFCPGYTVDTTQAEVTFTNCINQ